MKAKVEEEWLSFFGRVFDEIKKMVYANYPVEKDGSGSRSTLAIREAVKGFLCSLRIVEIKIKSKEYNISDEFCQIVRYDLSRLGERDVEYYGVIDSKNKEKLRRILIRYFNLSEKDFEEFYKDFLIIGWFNDKLDYYTQFKRYNIKNNLRKFVFELYGDIIFLLGKKLTARFEKETDFNILFNLESDPILSFNEIARKDPINRMMMGITLRSLQEQVSSLQLIPNVPKHVKRVFNRAKKLFIFGYFYYGFFTISEHYAFLALESAIRHRYVQSLGEIAIIKNPEGEVIELVPSWYSIFDFCKRRKWSISKITVNGKSFPYNNRCLLKWLVEKNIITKWEEKQYNIGINIRNLLSHQEFSPIHMPNSFALNKVAERINKIFYITKE